MESEALGENLNSNGHLPLNDPTMRFAFGKSSARPSTLSSVPTIEEPVRAASTSVQAV